MDTATLSHFLVLELILERCSWGQHQLGWEVAQSLRPHALHDGARLERRPRRLALLSFVLREELHDKSDDVLPPIM